MGNAMTQWPPYCSRRCRPMMTTTRKFCPRTTRARSYGFLWRATGLRTSAVFSPVGMPRFRSGRSFGCAMRRMRIGCRTTDYYRRTIAPGTACPTIAGVRCARMPRCRRMPAIRSPRLAAERRSSPAAIRSRVTTTTRAKATVLPFMHPSKDRRSRCRCPRSRGHCASPPPSHETGRWRQSGSPPVRQGGLRNGAGR